MQLGLKRRKRDKLKTNNKDATEQRNKCEACDRRRILNCLPCRVVGFCVVLLVGSFQDEERDATTYPAPLGEGFRGRV